jgi:2-polyprenyl-3-methyl-5-hydroxy-6-metoxy-1,4-benzoquinol methylase
MFKNRSYETEIMDDLALGGEDMSRTLKELDLINTWLGGNAVVTNGLNYLRQRPQGRPFFQKSLTIADLGCGGGDLLKVMARWARKRNIQAELTGVDANGYIVDYAQANCRDFPEIHFRQEDIFSPAFAREPFDVIVCSLFCHHFTDEQLVKMFRQMHNQARLGVIINDLHRHPLAYYSIKALTAAFSKSYLVKNDGPLSVLRAFRKPEIRRLVEEAGIRKYRLRWMWAFRWQLVLIKL